MKSKEFLKQCITVLFLSCLFCSTVSCTTKDNQKNTDFEESIKDIPKGSFVYLDPPYDPVSKTSNFTGYNQGGFGDDEQIRIKNMCDKLNDNGIKFLLSNSATPFIKDLYKDYTIEIVNAKRTVNSKADKRGEIEEVLIRNSGINTNKK